MDGTSSRIVMEDQMLIKEEYLHHEINIQDFEETKIKTEKNTFDNEAFEGDKWLIKKEQLHHEINIEEVEIKTEKNTFENEALEDKMEEIISGSDESQPELVEKAKNGTLNSLPKNSRALYEKRYNNFITWCTSKKETKYSENILLAYFLEQCKIFKPPTIWSIYSMLKSTLLTKNNINIAKYSKLISFIKQNGVGYKPKKSKTLSRDQILTFLREAPDENYLMIKVALIFGIFGACRRHELYNLHIQDVKEVDNVVVINIPDTKTYQPRTFTIVNDEESGVDYLDFYKRYSLLRLNKSAGSQRFFLSYANGRCINQVVGINTLGSLPSIIAKYLNLENTELFTGHCFRRSSATLSANAGAKLGKIKPHGGWKSSTVAEGYIDDSINNKIGTTSKARSNSPYRPSLDTKAPTCLNTNNLKGNFLPSRSSSNEQTIVDFTSSVTNSDAHSNLSSLLNSYGINIQNCSNVTVNLMINNNK